MDSGRLPGSLVAVVRGDRLAWFETCGYRDVEAKLPVAPDTVYRIYSMTKPVTTAAALMRNFVERAPLRAVPEA